MDPEQLVKDWMERTYGLILEKIPESTTKTPDFSISFDANLIGYAELKTLERVDPSQTPGWSEVEEMQVHEEGMTMSMHSREDNSVNRVSNCIEKAYEQLRGYPSIRCLIILNASYADVGDLEECIYGYSEFEGQTPLRLVSDPRAHKRLLPILPAFDIFIWLDRKGARLQPFLRGGSPTGVKFAQDFLMQPRGY
ncbi:hypothetical protein [Deinococcus multiflagellatus]|uniref:Uncharacterized protein n=1 Tax=Deinococcus multiflagellatus TaxID=1656887 RepID=A0ABW1ZFX2_9DEIO|nr:hypothetical protein [Deinococcus multiflagellatus]MBZ9711782.1 hypothetical protein [Deinococcus multiflagellatus]